MSKNKNSVVRRGDHTVIAGTSIRTSAVLELFMEEGADAEVLAKQYRDAGVRVTSSQIQQAIRFECCRTCKCEKCAWAKSL